MTYKDFAQGAARAAGEIIKNNFSLGMKKEWKANETPVTATDLAVNRYVIEEMKKYFPEHSLLGEEESFENAQSEYKWVCDPVDGTIPFSHGIPTCAFMLALTKHGESILGIIYDPFQDRMFFAEKGKGTTLNNDKIHVSSKKDLKNAMVGILHWSGAEYDLRPVFAEIDDRWALNISLCSTGYMGMLVSCGEFVANIFQGTDDHAVDVAAQKS